MIVPTMTAAPLVLDLAHAAAILGCSLAELTQAIREHHLHAIQIGGVWFTTAAALVDYDYYYRSIPTAPPDRPLVVGSVQRCGSGPSVAPCGSQNRPAAGRTGASASRPDAGPLPEDRRGQRPYSGGRPRRSRSPLAPLRSPVRPLD